MSNPVSTPSGGSKTQPVSSASAITPRHLILLKAQDQLEWLVARTGLRSSELWLVATCLAMVALAFFGGKMPPAQFALATTFLGTFYTIFRSQVKSALGFQVAAITDKIEADPAQAAAIVEQALPTVIAHNTIGDLTADNADGANKSPSKIVPMIAAIAACLLLYTGCASASPLSATQQASLTSLGQSATTALIKASASAATATNYSQGATVALRSLEGSLVTPATVKAAVQSFGPTAPALAAAIPWAQLAAEIGSAYASAKPKTPAAASAALEALAQGFDAATTPPAP